MKNEIATTNETLPAEQNSNGIFLDVTMFEHAQRVATMLSKTNMVPAHFQGNVGNCMIALNFAGRANLDPFMLMQSMYVIHGKPGLEGKLAIALLNKSGLFSPLKFNFSGEGDNRSCTACAIRKATGDMCEQTLMWETVVKEGWLSKKGSKWATMPDLMFQYRVASFFIKIHAPEVLLGMQTKEELDDTYAVLPVVSDVSLSQKLKNISPVTPQVTVTEKEPAHGKEQPNPIQETGAWKEWVEIKNQFPEVVNGWPDPTTEEQCLEAIKAVGIEVDKLNA